MSRQPLIGAVLFGAVIALFAPLSHNPDANYYYGVALRVSEGRIRESVDGLYAPLLSWLLAPLMALGLDPRSSFRLVSFANFITLLSVTQLMGKELGLRRGVVGMALLFVSLHLAYFQAAVVTPDLLASTLYVAMCGAALRASRTGRAVDHASVGLFGGLAYLAKPILLPIGALILILVAVLHRKDQGARIGASFALLAMATVAGPWCLVLSLRYERPLFTAQQLLPSHPTGRYDYSPNNFRVLVEPDRPPPVEPTVRRVHRSRIEAIQFAIPYLCRSARDLLFGDTLPFYLALALSFLARAAARGEGRWRIVAVFAAMEGLTHLVIWGPYLRYFFPVAPLLHLAFFEGATRVGGELDRRGKGRVAFAWRATVATMVLASGVRTAKAISADWRDAARLPATEFVRFARELPLLQGRTGALTGPSTSQLPPIAAYALGREYWSSIIPELNEPSEMLAKRLEAWRVTQILWVGPLYPSLDRLTTLQRAGPFMVGGETVHVYSLKESIGDSP